MPPGYPSQQEETRNTLVIAFKIPSGRFPNSEGAEFQEVLNSRVVAVTEKDFVVNQQMKNILTPFSRGFSWPVSIYI
jgi:hypothetical protein